MPARQTTSQSGLSTSNKQQLDWRENAVWKWLLVLAVLAPLPPAITLLCISVTNHTFDGVALVFVDRNRASVQILVTIVAGLMSTANLYVIVCVVRFATRIRLGQSGISLMVLKVVEVFTKQQMVLEATPTIVVISVLGFALLSVPHIVWVGSLTPVVAPSSPISRPGLFSIPDYTLDSAFNWANFSSSRLPDSSNSCGANFSSTESVLSACPSYSMSGVAMSALAHASTWKNASDANGHPKVDGSGYRYLGRSYGVASSVGLVPEPSTDVLSYQYTEPGYLVRSSCMLNSSSAWGYRLVQQGKAPNGIPDIYYAQGYLPNSDGNLEFLAVPTYSDARSLFTYVARDRNDQQYLAIAAGPAFLWLNGTQCQFHFSPTDFAVSVNSTARTIKVTPTTPNDWFGAVPGLVATAMGELAQYNSLQVSLFANVIGRSLAQNINTWNTISNAGQGGDNMTAVQDSFEAALDDLLVFVGAAQIRVKSGPYAREVNATYISLTVSIGRRPYILASSAISFLLLALVLLECHRTRWWRDLPKFDFTDIAGLVMASRFADRKPLDPLSKPWDGSSTPATNAKLRMKLRIVPSGIALAGIQESPEGLATPSSWH